MLHFEIVVVSFNLYLTNHSLAARHKPTTMAELTTSGNGKSSGSIRSQKKAVRVDLTAMVDLAFLLITFFILTTTLQKPQIMDVTMPVEAPPDGVAASQTMTVLLGANNKLSWYIGQPDAPVNGTKVVDFSRMGIRKVLIDQGARVKREQGKDLIVLIKPSDQSKYENLVNMMDELDITDNKIRAIVDITPKDVQLMKKDNIYN